MAVGTDSVPAGLAVFRCLSQPAVSAQTVAQKVLPKRRPQLAQRALCANTGDVPKDTCGFLITFIPLLRE